MAVRTPLADAAVTGRPSLPVPVPDGYLTTDDVALVYRASASTVRYWRQKGLGPRWFRSGRRVLYDSADVRDHLRRLRDEAR